MLPVIGPEWRCCSRCKELPIVFPQRKLHCLHLHMTYVAQVSSAKQPVPGNTAPVPSSPAPSCLPPAGVYKKVSSLGTFLHCRWRYPHSTSGAEIQDMKVHPQLRRDKLIEGKILVARTCCWHVTSIYTCIPAPTLANVCPETGSKTHQNSHFWPYDLKRGCFGPPGSREAVNGAMSVEM